MGEPALKIEDKKCSHCAEIVKAEAIVCKHCGNDLVEMEYATKNAMGFTTNMTIKQMEDKGWTFVGEESKQIAGSSLGKLLKFKRPKSAKSMQDKAKQFGAGILGLVVIWLILKYLIF